MNWMMEYYYEPGNGTRYHLVYGRIGGAGGGMITDKYMIAWLSGGGSGGSCFRWQHYDDLRSYHWSYISEKMGIREADAKAIVEFMESHHATRVRETKED